MLAIQLVGPPRTPVLPESVGLYRRVRVDTLTRAQAVRGWYVRSNGIELEADVLWSKRRANRAAARDQIDSLTASLAALRAAGRIAGYRVAYVDTVSVAVGPSFAAGYTTVIPIESRAGGITVAVAFVYAVAGRYVIVRGAVPPQELDQADISGFARQFIERYISSGSP